MYYPGCRLVTSDPGEPAVIVKITEKREPDSVCLQVQVVEERRTTTDEQVLEVKGDEDPPETEIRRLMRLLVYRTLARHCGEQASPYGILTGVRPVKLVQRWLDQRISECEIRVRLQKDYQVHPEKVNLLLDIASTNRDYLLSPEKASRLISLYVGIPFCPGRCLYCSFPGAVLSSYEQMEPFLGALEKEMQTLGELLQQLGLVVQNIYVGGGTPTVLGEEDLKRFFDWLHRHYISNDTQEITMEAGRPDTLTLSKLKLLHELGVTRVAINPQTMNESTLRRIGRLHTSGEVIRAMEWAREAGFQHINMDLIVGLPGEGPSENMYTAARVLELRPENVTVHTLAVKRGSPLAEKGRNTLLPSGEVTAAGVNLFRQLLTGAGYIPYYLYRQKQMLVNLENLGYSLPGCFGIYNIQMIEERQTILGLGGGATSKFVNPRDWTFRSFYNPRNPDSYINSLPRLIRSKVDNLLALT